MGDMPPDHKLQDRIITDKPVFDDEFIVALIERITMLKQGISNNGIVIIVIAGLITLAVIVQQIILSVIHGFV